jgi:hypothetical protein
MDNLKVVPWKHAGDYLEVGQWLLGANELLSNNNGSSSSSDDASFEKVRRAIARVAVWRIRAGHEDLPHCLESTACLAEMLLHDGDSHQSKIQASCTSSSSSSNELRLAYSSIIIRGVNGIADALQPHRGRLSKVMTVANLCKRISMPSWLVVMRHDAAHGALPSLPCLRMAARALLEFLGTAYWQPLVTDRQSAKALAHENLIKAKLVFKETQKRRLEHNNHQEAAAAAEEEHKNESHTATAGGDNTHNLPLPSPKKQKKMYTRTTGQYVTNFVKKVSCDIGLDTALSFLVYGMDPNSLERCEDSSSSRRGGVLAPSDVVGFPESEEGITNIRVVFVPLLSKLQVKWTAFTRLLLIEIVHAMLVLVRAASAYEATATSYEGGEEQLTVVGTTRRTLFFLSSWVNFLISDEWQARYQAQVAEMKGNGRASPNPKSTGNNTKSGVGEKRKRHRTTVTEAVTTVIETKEEPILQQLPLNSLCDRCEEELCHTSTSAATNHWTHTILAELHTAFSMRLGEQRVCSSIAIAPDDHQRMDMDTVSTSTPSSNSDGAPLSSKEGGLIGLEDIEQILAGAGSLHPTTSTSQHQNNPREQQHQDSPISSSQASSVPPVVADNEKNDNTQKLLSLEEMEILTTGTGIPPRGGESDGHRECLVEHQNQYMVAAASSSLEEKTKRNITWIRCPTWDPCPIGSLPNIPYGQVV